MLGLTIFRKRLARFDGDYSPLSPLASPSGCLDAQMSLTQYLGAPFFSGIKEPPRLAKLTSNTEILTSVSGLPIEFKSYALNDGIF